MTLVPESTFWRWFIFFPTVFVVKFSLGRPNFAPSTQWFTLFFTFLSRSSQSDQTRCGCRFSLFKVENAQKYIRCRCWNFQSPYIFLQPQQQQSNKDWLYFEILFISDRLDRKITKIFRKENIDARITHRVYTLRNALSTRRNEPQCKRTNCPVALRQFAFVETPSTRSHATDASNSMSAAPTDTHTTG